MPKFLVIAGVTTPLAFPFEAATEWDAIAAFNAAAEDPGKLPQGFPVGPDEDSALSESGMYAYEAIQVG